MKDIRRIHKSKRRSYMSHTKILVKKKKNIALIAHDERKQDLLEWVKFNKGTLSQHNLFGTCF